MKLRNSFLVASAVALSAAFSLSAHADDPAPFSLKAARFMGSGCTARDSAAVGLEGDGVAAISVLFSNMISQGTVAGRGTPKTCGVALTLEPNQGIQLALIDVKLSGSVDVFGSQNSSAGINNVVRVTRNYGFNGVRSNAGRSGGGGYDVGPLNTYMVNSSSFYEIQEDTVGVITYSPCGKPIIARADLVVQSNGVGTYGDISALDANVALKYLVRTRTCKNSDPEDTQVITVPPDERATVRNVCILRGVQNGRITSSTRQVCFDQDGNAL